MRSKNPVESHLLGPLDSALELLGLNTELMQNRPIRQ
jgi:hypothetical protein